jgi:hypothetical protein
MQGALRVEESPPAAGRSWADDRVAWAAEGIEDDGIRES